MFKQPAQAVVCAVVTGKVDIENTTQVPVGDDLSYNEWFLKRI